MKIKKAAVGYYNIRYRNSGKNHYQLYVSGGTMYKGQGKRYYQGYSHLVKIPLNGYLTYKQFFCHWHKIR